MESTESKLSPNRPESRQKLAAVMFADMVEYSKRLEQDEAGNSVQAARAIDLFKALIGDYGGRVANVAGDACGKPGSPESATPVRALSHADDRRARACQSFGGSAQ